MLRNSVRYLVPALLCSILQCALADEFREFHHDEVLSRIFKNGRSKRQVLDPMYDLISPVINIQRWNGEAESVSFEGLGAKFTVTMRRNLELIRPAAQVMRIQSTQNVTEALPYAAHKHFVGYVDKKDPVTSEILEQGVAAFSQADGLQGSLFFGDNEIIILPYRIGHSNITDLHIMYPALEEEDDLSHDIVRLEAVNRDRRKRQVAIPHQHLEVMVTVDYDVFTELGFQASIDFALWQINLAQAIFMHSSLATHDIKISFTIVKMFIIENNELLEMSGLSKWNDIMDLFTMFAFEWEQPLWNAGGDDDLNYYDVAMVIGGSSITVNGDDNGVSSFEGCHVDNHYVALRYYESEHTGRVLARLFGHVLGMDDDSNDEACVSIGIMSDVNILSFTECNRLAAVSYLSSPEGSCFSDTPPDSVVFNTIESEEQRQDYDCFLRYTENELYYSEGACPWHKTYDTFSCDLWCNVVDKATRVDGCNNEEVMPSYDNSSCGYNMICDELQGCICPEGEDCIGGDDTGTSGVSSYKVITTLGHALAALECIAYGGTLAEIRNIETQNHLESFLESYTQHDKFYFALSRDITTGYRWKSNGDPPVFFYWVSGEPNDVAHECAVLSRSNGYKWLDYGCAEFIGAVCQILSPVTMTYWVPQPTYNREAANNMCNSYGGRLAKVGDAQTQTLVNTFLNEIGIPLASKKVYFSLGQTDGVWQFPDGQEIREFSNWLAEPTAEHNCAVMDVDSGYKWESVDCSTYLNTRHVCEFECVLSASWCHNGAIDMDENGNTCACICDIGWKGPFCLQPETPVHSWYSMSTDTATFYEAQANCSSLGAKLSPVLSPEMFQNVGDFAAANLESEVIVGLYKVGDAWMADGNQFQGAFTSWYGEQPLDYECADIRFVDNEWMMYGRECAVGSTKYMCEFECVEGALWCVNGEVISDELGCECKCDYSWSGQFCSERAGLMLWVNPESVNFESANDQCSALGGRLAPIPDAGTQESVETFLNSQVLPDPRIYFDIFMVNGTWYNSDSVQTWDNWPTAQPDGYDCGILRLKNGVYKWVFTVCTWSGGRLSLCEFDCTRSEWCRHGDIVSDGDTCFCNCHAYWQGTFCSESTTTTMPTTTTARPLEPLKFWVPQPNFSWYDSDLNCAIYGGRLATIVDRWTHDRVVRFLSSQNLATNIIFGLHNVSGVWQYDNGVLPIDGYENWKDEPESTDLCAFLRYANNYQWMAVDCTSGGSNHLCEFDCTVDATWCKNGVISINALEETCSCECDPDWAGPFCMQPDIQPGDPQPVHYYTHKRETEYTIADYDCTLFGGKLAQVHSPELFGFLTAYAESNNEVELGVGLRKVGSTWMSYHVTPQSGYLAWFGGQPADTDDCAFISFNSADNTWGWKGTSCDSKTKKYVCEFDCFVDSNWCVHGDIVQAEENGCICQCHAGWTGHFCAASTSVEYWVTPNNVNALEARDECTARGGSLAIIANIDTLCRVSMILGNQTFIYNKIIFDLTLVNSVWENSHGVQLFRNWVWPPTGTEDCATMRMDLQYIWQPSSCAWRDSRYGLCEFDCTSGTWCSHGSINILEAGCECVCSYGWIGQLCDEIDPLASTTTTAKPVILDPVSFWIPQPTWPRDRAQSLCEMHGGRLAVVVDKWTQARVQSYLASTNPVNNKVFFGLRFVNGLLGYDSGEEVLNYTNWMSGHPLQEYDCAVFSLCRGVILWDVFLDCLTDTSWCVNGQVNISIEDESCYCQCSANWKGPFCMEPESPPALGYSVSDIPADYVTASSVCGASGGTLARIQSPEMFQNLVNFIQSTGQTDVWFGLALSGSNWIYEDGTLQSGFSAWRGSHPNLRDCAYLKSSNGMWEWYGAGCTSLKYYVCQFECDDGDSWCFQGDVVAHETAGCVCECHSGWVGEFCKANKNIAYWVNPVSVNAITARTVCQDKGGRLAKIDSFDQLMYIGTFLDGQTLSDPRLYFDLQLNNTEWYNNDGPQSFLNGLSVGDGTKTCVMLKYGPDMAWNEQVCTWAAGRLSLCEFDCLVDTQWCANGEIQIDDFCTCQCSYGWMGTFCDMPDPTATTTTTLFPTTTTAPIPSTTVHFTTEPPTTTATAAPTTTSTTAPPTTESPTTTTTTAPTTTSTTAPPTTESPTTTTTTAPTTTSTTAPPTTESPTTTTTTAPTTTSTTAPPTTEPPATTTTTAPTTTSTTAPPTTEPSTTTTAPTTTSTTAPPPPPTTTTTTASTLEPPSSNVAFWLSEHTISYDNASLECQMYGGRLATVTSQATQERAVSYMNTVGVSSLSGKVFFRLQRINDVWGYDSGEILEYSNWKYSEEFDWLDCAVFRSTDGYLWERENCTASWEIYHLCEFECIETTNWCTNGQVVTNDSGYTCSCVCDIGWKGTFCKEPDPAPALKYFASRALNIYADAESDCALFGGRLAQTQSQEMFDSVTSFAMSIGLNNWYSGLHMENGKWMSVENVQQSAFMAWKSAQPHDEQCAFMKYDIGAWTWRGTSCTSKRKYVCEFDCVGDTSWCKNGVVVETADSCECRCHDGWSGDFCRVSTSIMYWVNPQPVNGFEARTECQARGGRLAKVADIGTHIAVASFLESVYLADPRVYIGIQKIVDEWVNDDGIQEYFQWNGIVDETNDCVALLQTADFAFQANKCTWSGTRISLCEFDCSVPDWCKNGNIVANTTSCYCQCSYGWRGTLCDDVDPTATTTTVATTTSNTTAEASVMYWVNPVPVNGFRAHEECVAKNGMSAVINDEETYANVISYLNENPAPSVKIYFNVSRNFEDYIWMNRDGLQQFFPSNWAFVNDTKDCMNLRPDQNFKFQSVVCSWGGERVGLCEFDCSLTNRWCINGYGVQTQDSCNCTCLDGWTGALCDEPIVKRSVRNKEQAAVGGAEIHNKGNGAKGGHMIGAIKGPNALSNELVYPVCRSYEAEIQEGCVFEGLGCTFELNLTLNLELAISSAKTQFFNSGGFYGDKFIKPQHCHYLGVVMRRCGIAHVTETVGRAAITLCGGLGGTLFFEGTRYSVVPVDHTDRFEGTHILYEDPEANRKLDTVIEVFRAEAVEEVGVRKKFNLSRPSRDIGRIKKEIPITTTKHRNKRNVDDQREIHVEIMVTIGYDMYLQYRDQSTNFGLSLVNHAQAVYLHESLVNSGIYVKLHVVKMQVFEATILEDMYDVDKWHDIIGLYSAYCSGWEPDYWVENNSDEEHYDIAVVIAGSSVVNTYDDNGLASFRGCNSNHCSVLKYTSFEQAGGLFAHEIGLTLGMYYDSKNPICPAFNSDGTVGIMDDPGSVFFTECNKYELLHYVNSPGVDCFDNAPVPGEWKDYSHNPFEEDVLCQELYYNTPGYYSERRCPWRTPDVTGDCSMWCEVISIETGRKTCSREMMHLPENSAIACGNNKVCSMNECVCPPSADCSDKREVSGIPAVYYKVVSTENTPWVDFNKGCHRLGGRGLKISNLATQAAVVEVIKSRSPTAKFYLDIHRNSSESNQWHTYKQESVYFYSWLPGEPDQNENECAVLSRNDNYEWVDHACDGGAGFICQFDCSDPEWCLHGNVTLIGDSCTCDCEAGWKGEFCEEFATLMTPKYVLPGGSANAVIAQEACLALHGTLPDVSSSDAHDNFKNFLSAMSPVTGDVYVDLTLKRSIWREYSGKASHVVMWADGEPRVNNTCTTVGQNYSYQWKSSDCQDVLLVVCEFSCETAYEDWCRQGDIVSDGNGSCTCQCWPGSYGTFCEEYDYSEVLYKSLLFFETQRSGVLPPDNRIPWRFDSALDDMSENGDDLTGGWYDAGDHCKFSFSHTGNTLRLAWGFLEFKDGYEAAGQLDVMYATLKWGLDYIIKLHTAKYELYACVCNASLDHTYWGRPEDMTMERPAFKIDADNPGSDLAGNAAAALAASYLIFKDIDPAYAALSLSHARDLYDFAYLYRGIYSYNTDVNNYLSSSYYDELVNAAIWMYDATGEVDYLEAAKTMYDEFGLDVTHRTYSWTSAAPALQLLLYLRTQDMKYGTGFEDFLNGWLPGGTVTYTPKGLAWRSPFQTLKIAANAAFLSLVAAKNGLNVDTYLGFARGQLHYILGDTGRSFVGGFGMKPPIRIHHRASSCPTPPEPCNFGVMRDNKPNPNILYGALVGGPDVNDNYEDAIPNWSQNEADIYQAGFQSAIAGLIYFKNNGTIFV
uniref:cellulase n=1 Tax=Saccoglossus kowalevskii TaxID=10224 RepID=A0ABM0GJL5_SACKO|nr:PREDICTED: uncharacterized protein LOC100368972 [Saccoglossus kowalevskii]